jgi:hypothetical protein
VNAPLIVAGSLAILGAAIHGVGGDVLVMRKLSPGMLPTSRFGGPGMTKTMIHITWHMTTIAFRTVGSAQPPCRGDLRAGRHRRPHSDRAAAVQRPGPNPPYLLFADAPVDSGWASDHAGVVVDLAA